MDLAVRVAAVDDAGEVEELRALVEFAPETVLEPLLGGAQRALLLEQVEMGEDTKHVARHAGRRENVQEFHRLHLKAVVPVDHEQHDVCDLGHIDHAGQGVGGAFEESKPLSLGGHDGERPLGRAERLLGVAPDQGFYERSFTDLRSKRSKSASVPSGSHFSIETGGQNDRTYPRRSNDSNDSRGCLFGQAIHEGHMEPLLLDLYPVKKDNQPCNSHCNPTSA